MYKDTEWAQFRTVRLSTKFFLKFFPVPRKDKFFDAD